MLGLPGYLIPRGTEVIFNYYAVHMNGKVHAQPADFRPARFLDDQGKFLSVPGYYAFGTGELSVVDKLLCIQT